MTIPRTIIQTSVAVGIFVVIVAVYGVGVYIIQNMERQFMVEQQNLVTAKKQIEDSDAVTRLLENTKDERGELESYMIRQKDIINFLSLVEALGRTHGAVVSTESLNVAPKDEFTEELHVTIKAAGSFEAVLHVLDLLEILPYKSYVSEASLNEESSLQGGTGRWIGTYTIVVVKHKERT